MPEEKDGTGPTGNPDTQAFLPTPLELTIEQRIVALEAESQSRKDAPISKELAREVKLGERWLIFINGLALVASIGIGIVYIKQLRAMRDANEMTRQALLVASQNSIESSKQFQAQLSHFDNGLGRTGLLAIHAGEQATAATKIASITAKQFEESHSLIDSQRASIGVSFNKVYNPITFHDGSASIVFSIDLHNSGALKATHVSVRFKAYYSLWGKNIFTEPLQKQRDYCAAPLAPEENWGWDEKGQRINLEGLRDFTATVEPNGNYEWQLNFGMGKPTPADIIKWPPNDATQGIEKLPVTDRILPIIVGCVDYQSGSMPERHQTGFIFEVQEAYFDAAVPNAAPTMVHYGIDLPINRVVITQFYFGQGKKY